MYFLLTFILVKLVLFNNTTAMYFQSRCNELVCHLNVTYLQPCKLQTFELTPYYLNDGVTTQGSNMFTDATTLESGQYHTLIYVFFLNFLIYLLPVQVFMTALYSGHEKLWSHCLTE